jgi:hypothetical protein
MPSWLGQIKLRFGLREGGLKTRQKKDAPEGASHSSIFKK